MIEGTRRLRPAALLLSLALLAAACSSGAGDDGRPAPPADGGGTDAEARLVLVPEDGGEVIVHAEVADTDEERARGLMGRESLAEDAGMVFLHEEPVEQSFWMKDTLIPLSIAFWNPEGEILNILDMEPCEADPCTIYEPGAAWVGAVEVNQGFFDEHGIEIGDTARLER